MRMHIYGDVTADAGHGMPPSQLSTLQSSVSICGFVEANV